ncbi:N-(5'-phosphoribosyl)anthranilate isomerase [Aestuariibius sp. 2305UL40-4]|uniref:N-(5'-phosphoribosyl)anthranilate isomerase n=1 Tax=Aestuariibius violaceus TaxID=3234132 RepID=UPI00349438F6
MKNLTRKPVGQDWLDQIFCSQSALRGGAVRRRKADVLREVGLDRLELEVRRRGFHMVDCGTDLVISCSGTPLRIIY